MLEILRTFAVEKLILTDSLLIGNKDNKYVNEHSTLHRL